MQTFITLLLFCVSLYSLSSKVVEFEGHFTYGIEVVKIPNEIEHVRDSYPSDITYYVNSKFIYAPEYSIFNAGIVANKTSGIVYYLRQYNNDKYKCVSVPNRNEYISFTKNNRDTVINGFNCYGIDYRNSKLNTSYVIWFTKEYPELRHPDFFDFKDLPVRYEFIIPSAETHLIYTLKEVKKDRVSAELFPDTLSYNRTDCANVYK